MQIGHNAGDGMTLNEIEKQPMPHHRCHYGGVRYSRPVLPLRCFYYLKLPLFRKQCRHQQHRECDDCGPGLEVEYANALDAALIYRSQGLKQG